MSRILFLHGASSSGKSTLARAIREVSHEPWAHLSFDMFRDSGALLPGAYADWPARRATAFKALHQTFATFAAAGFDLIIEHILDTEGWHTELQRLLAGHSVLFVGLQTPVDVLTRREAERDDRADGSALRDGQTIHRGLHYDLELDGTADPATNALRVLQETPSPASTFFDIRLS
ncbi:chloramphenicol phosphotransferase CPT family protein [Marivita hallyeonensis]|uniref:Chloramphenicol 3-O phosphotransferase n=1 Tax=Marivita hallyeonensis TaxID=996342 RepID=A0A1M5XGT3_9RHOB|nr:AAA family ATPase [Marivita hallyeonensis]SHH98969.1 chloramphenicol 3-O phosphotransferase [Marivita hallyeonensis]